MKRFQSLHPLIEKAILENKNVSDIVLEYQSHEMEKDKENLFREMERRLKIMGDAVSKGLQAGVRSKSGLSGGDARKMIQALEKGSLIDCGLMTKAMCYATAAAEYNACMGRIVAAPTAGSCGILPGVILSVSQAYPVSPEKTVMSLFTAAGVGMVIANRASLSGAEGGCQAECGSASAMAAAAAVELMGGTPDMVSHAAAIAIKCILGLICDPVAGLVECPCVKRNASGSANALSAANMALSGVTSVIPADEVFDAMKSVGHMMSPLLKETSLGGIAVSPAAREIEKKFHKDSESAFC